MSPAAQYPVLISTLGLSYVQPGPSPLGSKPSSLIWSRLSLARSLRSLLSPVPAALPLAGLPQALPHFPLSSSTTGLPWQPE